MTIRIPKKNLLDHILARCGKRRGVIIPTGVYDRFGPYVYASARRESFWRALIRHRNAPLPEGIVGWEKFLEPIKELRHRREILFCHDFLFFLECRFPGAEFGDDLKGHSRAEFFFIHKGAFYLVEAKSETETEDSKHPGWHGSFQKVRDSIKSLELENRYNKWLLYLAQLNDYATHQKHHLRTAQFNRRFVMLGFPLTKLPDCVHGIKMATQSHAFPELRYECDQDVNRRVAYVFAQEESLSSFFGNGKG